MRSKTSVCVSLWPGFVKYCYKNHKSYLNVFVFKLDLFVCLFIRILSKCAKWKKYKKLIYILKFHELNFIKWKRNWEYIQYLCGKSICNYLKYHVFQFVMCGLSVHVTAYCVTYLFLFFCAKHIFLIVMKHFLYYLQRLQK